MMMISEGASEQFVKWKCKTTRQRVNKIVKVTGALYLDRSVGRYHKQRHKSNILHTYQLTNRMKRRFFFFRVVIIILFLNTRNIEYTLASQQRLLCMN